MKFKSFNLHPKVAAGIAAAGYVTPTPIQAQAITKILKGQDLIGLAQTGTGKTAAFVLPMLNQMIKRNRGHIRALIMVPTRELAKQIDQVIDNLGCKTDVTSSTVYGGVGIHPQIQKLKRADIVVACPGRLLDLLSRHAVDLSQLNLLVLDEADQMLDMGFFPDIRRILKHLPKKRQTLLFSATMPAEIRNLTREILHEPTTVQVGVTAPADTVHHALYPVSQHLKTALLLKLLDKTTWESVLVFTRTKHRAKSLGKKLAAAGYRSTSLEGNLSQNRRQAALEGFQNRTFQILVATDIAARGIDVTHISHIINYDIPSTPEAYIHRIGRTGRATRSGEAFTFITEDDRNMVRAINQTVGISLEKRRLSDFDYNADPLSHQRRGPNRTSGHQPKGRKPSNSSKGRDRKGAFAWLTSQNGKKAGRQEMQSA